MSASRYSKRVTLPNDRGRESETLGLDPESPAARWYVRVPGRETRVRRSTEPPPPPERRVNRIGTLIDESWYRLERWCPGLDDSGGHWKNVGRDYPIVINPATGRYAPRGLCNQCRTKDSARRVALRRAGPVTRLSPPELLAALEALERSGSSPLSSSARGLVTERLAEVRGNAITMTPPGARALKLLRQCRVAETRGVVDPWAPWYARGL